MIRITCKNAKCDSPNRKFDWNETPHVNAGGGLASEHDSDATRVVIICPYCQTPNLIWLKGVKRDDILLRGEQP